jgi:hypothetical protein
VSGDGLPRKWFSAGGGGKLWTGGRFATYVEVPYERLPPIVVDGTFGWLAEPPVGLELLDFRNTAPGTLGAELERRTAEAAQLGLALPPTFVSFMSDASLSARVPTCTACYFDLGARLIEVPGILPRARMLRFLNDQQACRLWYLLLEADGTHSVVSALPHWHAEGPTLEDAIVPRGIAVCASSFEEFMKRFWIENTLWYALNKGRPAIDGELRAYLDAAQESQSSA